jgi:hypothetical protein
VRIVGEPVWAGRSRREVRSWIRYESMLNLSFARSPVTIVCAYNTQSLAASVVAGARRTHPELMSGTGSVASQHFRDPEAFLLEP